MQGLEGLGLPAENPARTAQLRALFEERERAFLEMSEEDQMLSLIAGQVAFVSGNVCMNEGEVARIVITKSHGPKFAERVLADPDLRKKIGLDQPKQVQDESVIAYTVAVNE
ncbi:MAG: hypothetical protein JWL75_575 [Parcubacteria group bacterium]|nr:hypothetical protein [Parcubacteria group bacterium]